MATRCGTAVASGENSQTTAMQAVTEALTKMGNQDQLKLVIVYVWPHYDLSVVIDTIRSVTKTTPLIGCTCSGGFTDQDYILGGIAITTIASDNMQIKLGCARNFTDDLPLSVRQVVADFNPIPQAGLRGRTLLLFTDALVGQGEKLIDEIMLQTNMQYQLFGAAAADDFTFSKTQVFANDDVLSNAFVCAEILSEKPFSIAAQHGWMPLSEAYRVTRSEGATLYELNGQSAWAIYQKFASKHNLTISEGNESGFLMQYILGIETSDQYKLRVPLALNADGSLLCAAEIPDGATVFIMKSNKNDVSNSGRLALKSAKQKSETDQFAGALACECVSTRLQLGPAFIDTIRLTGSELRPTQILGLVSYGQLARTTDEFSGLGCASSLVCLIPK